MVKNLICSNILEDFNTALYGIIAFILICGLIYMLVKFPSIRVFIISALSIIIFGTAIFSGIQLNYYYSASGGIYGYLKGYINPNSVTVDEGTGILTISNICLEEKEEDGKYYYFAECTFQQTYLLDTNLYYNLYINEIPCDSYEMYNMGTYGVDYFTAKNTVSFFDDDGKVIAIDTISITVNFYENYTRIYLKTAEHEKEIEETVYYDSLWNSYFNKNSLSLEIVQEEKVYKSSNSYEIKLYLNNEIYGTVIVPEGYNYLLPDIEETTSYLFNYWTLDGEKISEIININSDLTVIANVNNYYYVSLYNDETLYETYKVDAGSNLTLPEIEIYNDDKTSLAIGWANSEGEIITEISNINSDLTIYSYSVDCYQIRFSLNYPDDFYEMYSYVDLNSVYSYLNYLTLRCDRTIDEQIDNGLKEGSIVGYKFLGWSSDGENIIDLTKYYPTQDEELVGLWESEQILVKVTLSDEIYSIEYNGNVYTEDFSFYVDLNDTIIFDSITANNGYVFDYYKTSYVYSTTTYGVTISDIVWNNGGITITDETFNSTIKKSGTGTSGSSSEYQSDSSSSITTEPVGVYFEYFSIQINTDIYYDFSTNYTDWTDEMLIYALHKIWLGEDLTSPSKIDFDLEKCLGYLYEGLLKQDSSSLTTFEMETALYKVIESNKSEYLCEFELTEETTLREFMEAFYAIGTVGLGYELADASSYTITFEINGESVTITRPKGYSSNLNTENYEWTLEGVEITSIDNLSSDITIIAK